MKKIFFSYLALTIIITISCFDDNNNDKTDTTLTIGIEDDGKTFSTAIGTNFKAIFDECSGCDDIWEIDQINISMITLIDQFTQNFSCTDCEGGSHEVVFEFEAISAGETEIIFSYFDNIINIIIQIE